MGIGADDKGNYYPTRIIVKEYAIQQIEPIEKIYAVRAKKNSQSPNGAGLSPEGVPLSKGYSTITIADFLRVVKDNFADTLSQNVLDEYGIQRPKSSLSDSVMYSLKRNPSNNDDSTEIEPYDELRRKGQEVLAETLKKTGANRPSELAEDTTTRRQSKKENKSPFIKGSGASSLWDKFYTAVIDDIMQLQVFLVKAMR